MEIPSRVLLEEFYRRQKHRELNPITRLRSPEFHKQNEVLDARGARFKAINCTRRSGKSIGEAIDHMEICEKYPGSRTLYLGITLDSVTEIIWDVFKDLADQGGYDVKFNEQKKIINFSNGSRVRLAGLDVSEKQMRKILGQKLRKVSIDEAGSITQNMRKICYQMIMPALSDLRPFSWLTLLGTCENIPNTFFEAVTNGEERDVDWRVFKWTAYENPFMRKQWTDEIAELKKNNPKVVEASWFKTHYLNVWCSDDDLIIIPWAQHGCYADELPEGKWNYILGVDLGYNDANSFSVLAYDYDSPVAYVVRVSKESKLDLSGVAYRIKDIQRKFDIQKIIVDGANKQGVEEIKNRHHIPLQAAEKSDKATYLRLLADDVKTGNLRLVKGGCGELVTEWGALQWKDEVKEKEDDRCQNHASDSTLYAWRECRHYTYMPPEPKKDLDSDEYMDELEEQESEELRRQEEEAEWWEMKLRSFTHDKRTIRERKGVHQVLPARKGCSRKAG